MTFGPSCKKYTLTQRQQEKIIIDKHQNFWYQKLQKNKEDSHKDSYKDNFKDNHKDIHKDNQKRQLKRQLQRQPQRQPQRQSQRQPQRQLQRGKGTSRFIKNYNRKVIEEKVSKIIEKYLWPNDWRNERKKWLLELYICKLKNGENVWHLELCFPEQKILWRESLTKSRKDLGLKLSKFIKNINIWLNAWRKKGTSKALPTQVNKKYYGEDPRLKDERVLD